MTSTTTTRRRYHYVITGQCPVPNTPGAWWTGMHDGTVDVPPGVTRTELFQHALTRLTTQAREQGVCAPDSAPQVLFWALELDQLPATAGEATGGEQP